MCNKLDYHVLMAKSPVLFWPDLAEAAQPFLRKDIRKSGHGYGVLRRRLSAQIRTY
jgi:hypothetical protein